MLLKNPLKLVIWDLDETFWKGTLTEEGIEPVMEHIRRLDHLTSRGIINSICSKNDPLLVEQKLAELGVADRFVFNQIAFIPKGEMIRQQLIAMQLRAENALFVDDRVANLEEASFMNPGLMTVTPDQLEEALCEPNAQGRPDPDCSRLVQYQQLEKRWQAQNNSELNNEEFLRQSDIQIMISRDWQNNIDRIVEILQRTNQLNFTKLRSTSDEVRQQLTGRCSDYGMIRVMDRYADYGWVGFYAIEDGRLLHFSFSCRILNMGVETWFYQHLGAPKLDIVKPVATDPTRLASSIDWIRQVNIDESAQVRSKQHYKGVVRASCNTDQIIPYLAGNIQFEKEFNYPGKSGMEIERQLMCWLVLAKEARNVKMDGVLQQLPVFDPGVLETGIDIDTDFIILSPVMDLMQGYYQHKETGIKISLDAYNVDITSEKFLTSKNQWETAHYSPAFLQWFKQEFASLGSLPDKWYLQQLNLMLEQWAPSAQLILLLPNDQDMGLTSHRPIAEHLRKYNDILRAWGAQRNRVTILDFSRMVNSAQDIAYDSLYLYNRKIYFRMAQEIQIALNTLQANSQIVRISVVKFMLSRLPYVRRNILYWIRRIKRAVEKRWPFFLSQSWLR